MNYSVVFLEHQGVFDKAMERAKDQPWIGFDTEFVGEKYYVPVLGLLQIVSEQNIYLVDTLKIRNLKSFLDIIEDPAVLKITHAGDNDYRLLNTLFGTVPQHTFDTQIAAGFVGYNYPCGFGKIVDKELKITLAKSHTIADWEARPLDPKALKYAVEDVEYLPILHEKLSNKLRQHHRESWAREENRKWEHAAFYQQNPNKEFFANDMIYQLDEREKVFLMRLYRWRLKTAATLDVPKEAVLQSRFISTVVRAVKGGGSAFKANRTMPENVWKRHLDAWTGLWKSPVEQEEQAIIAGITRPAPEDPEQEWTMELLYHLVKKQCIEHEISAALLFPRHDFNRLKSGSEDFDYSLLEGWRAELMGKELVEWFKAGRRIAVNWSERQCVLQM